MPWFEGTHSESRPLPLPPEAAVAHFADLEAIVAATKGVESSDVDGRTVHFSLEEEDHGVVKFKGDFRCTYEADGNTLRWATAEGANVEQSGEARFVPASGGCTITYTETVRVDLGVPAMMAPMLKPMIGPVLAKEIKGYLDRMVDALPGA